MNKRDLKKFQENYCDLQGHRMFSTGEIPAEGLRLAVHFDDKDEVKGWGAKWNAEEKYWWLPRPAVTMKRLHEINQRKMANGWHGTINDDRCMEWIGTDEPDQEYALVNDDATLTIRVWNKHDLIQIAKGTPEADPAGSLHETIENGRKSWNNLMEKGWRRLLKNDALSC